MTIECSQSVHSIASALEKLTFLMNEEPATSETVAQIVSGDDKKARILKELLLDLNFFRRDQIWFAEKNDETCATELYSLASFSPRKGENVRKGYLQGRFGAIPFIGGNA